MVLQIFELMSALCLEPNLWTEATQLTRLSYFCVIYLLKSSKLCMITIDRNKNDKDIADFPINECIMLNPRSPRPFFATRSPRGGSVWTPPTNFYANRLT